MTSRERLAAALEHRQPDRVPVDFGATAVTGIHVSAVSRLRQAVLGEKNYRVKVIEPYQMLGEIDDKLREALGIDVVGLTPRYTMFGFENEDWKPFTLFDGTEVLVPGKFNVTTTEDGDWLIYPQGDTTVPPSGRMPKGGYFFDSIIRQPPIDEDKLNPADNTEEFALLDEETLKWYEARIAEREATGCGVILTAPGLAFGDIALVPAPWMKHPRGIRDVEEWYVSTVTRRDYVHAVFEKQCEIGLKNLDTLIKLFGDRVQAVFITGTDFGTQRGPFISREAYRELYKPYH
ncbi:MAG: methyltransferase, partial [Verrucomicrobiae bacterium]|nr:methyltransferase [Verrucomicrobiae bacterium]